MTQPTTHARRRRRAAALVVTLVVGLLLAGPGSAGPVQAQPRAEPPGPWSILAPDGVERFYGRDFDSACNDTDDFEGGLHRMARLARLVEKSGRRAVFTVAPNKTAIPRLRELLRGSPVPHGGCARRGILAQQEMLDAVDDPLFLPLRQRIAADRRQLYWHSDLHWNTVGASVFAKQLAERLSPRVRRGLRYRPTTAAFTGILIQPYGSTPQEVGPGLLPDPRLTITPDPGQVEIDTSTTTTFDHSWSTTPARRAIRGRSLIIGDSFSYLGLSVLRPLFAHGRYMWDVHTEPADIIAAIVDSKTVVIEFVQLTVNNNPLLSATFRRDLRRALR